MSLEQLKEEFEGKITPWNSLLDKAKGFGKQAEGFRRGFESAYTFGATDLADTLAKKIVPLPEEVEPMEDDINIGTVLGGLIGGVKSPITSIFGKIAPGMETRKVQKIQKSFFPWVKKHTTEFGQAQRTGLKRLISGGKASTTAGETDAIFEPLFRDVAEQLPKKAKDVIERVKGKPVGIKQLISEKARLKRSLTVAERTGKASTERSRMIKNTVKNIDRYVNPKLPEVTALKPEYSKYTKVRGFMEKMFSPEEAHYGKLGTAKGTETLRNINKLQPAEIEALESFGKETGLNIVGPAKFASGLRSTGKTIAKYAVPTIFLSRLFRKSGISGDKSY